MHILKKHSHINWTLADQAIVSGVNFLTGLLIARFLGIEAFGIYSLVWMSILFVNSIQMAMISAPMMTIGPKQTNEGRSEYYGAVLVQQIIFSILSSFILWAGVSLSDLINPQWKISNLALPLATTLFFFQNQDFLRRIFFTEKRPIAAFISDVISYLGRVALLITLFFQITLTTEDVLWVISATSSLAMIISLCLLKNITFNFKHVLPVFKRHWILSKWMIASAILQWTSGNYFILAAASILGPVAVGALKAAQNIIGITHILFQGLENIVPAAASRHFKQNSVKGLNNYLLKVSLLGGGATLLIALSVSAFPDTLLNIVYGNQYDGYGYVLQWYALCYLLIFFSLPLRSGLRVLGVTRPIFIAYVLMSIFSISVASKMVESFGLTGVLLGTLATQFIMLTSLIYSFKFHTKKVEIT